MYINDKQVFSIVYQDKLLAVLKRKLHNHLCSPIYENPSTFRTQMCASKVESIGSSLE